MQKLCSVLLSDDKSRALPVRTSLRYKAAKYVRLSYADEKDRESNSVINQSQLIDEFLKDKPDIEVVSEKIDDGYSGIIFDRPAFQEMMNDISSGKINCVIVKDLSRLGREYIETGRYLRRIFPAYGVRFIAINDNIDTLKDSNTDDLTMSIKNIMNDSYCRDISVKTRSALETKRNNGNYVGACTVYGYKKDEKNKNHLVIDEYASKIVQDIFRMKIEGISAARIADELNRMGVLSPIKYKKNKGLPHPSGGYADKDNAKWSATTIIRILKDETYTDVLLQGKQNTYNYKLKNLINKPVSEWVRKEDTHEAIVKKHDFDLVQRIMQLDTRTSPNKTNVYLFSGILICGGCGNRMTRKSVPYKGKNYYYYYCPTGKKNGCNSSNMIKESDLIDCVSENLKAYINSIISFEELVNSINAERINKELVNKLMLQIKENEILIEETKKYKAGLYENLVSKNISKEDYTVYKKMYDDDKIRLESAVSELHRELDDVMNNRGENFKWIEHFKKYSDLKEINRKAVIQLIRSVKVFSKNEIQINFNYQLEYEKALSILTENKAVV